MSKLFVDEIVHQSSQGSGTITIGASGETVAVASGSNFSTTGITDNSTSTAITIDSSDNVGIGLTNPAYKLDIFGNQPSIQLKDDGATNQCTILATAADAAASLTVSRSGGNQSYGKLQSEGNTAYLQLSSLGNTASVIKGTSTSLAFDTNGSERMRISGTGELQVGKTSGAVAVQGHALYPDGTGAHTGTSVPILYINRLGTDGDLVTFYHDTIQEGAIYVTGTTVTYSGFTGSHWSRFTDNSTPNILKGTVLESLDEMCDWYNLHFEITDEEGNTSTQKIPYVLKDGQSDGDVITYNHEGTDVQATIVKEADIKHMKSKVSDTVDAKNVYGVFHAYDLDGEGYNDFIVASVGTFVVRIKQGETVAKGDLLQSNGDGTAKVQTDDAVRSSSFAKVLSTTIIETYEDGSYLVPCSLMC